MIVVLFEPTRASEHRAECDGGPLLGAFIYVGHVAFWLGTLGLQLQRSGFPIDFDVTRPRTTIWYWTLSIVVATLLSLSFVPSDY